MRDSNGNSSYRTDGSGISKPSRARRRKWSMQSVSVRWCWFNFCVRAETHINSRQTLAPRCRNPQLAMGWPVLLAPQHFSQGLVDVDSAVVANESLFPESVHEDIDSRAGSADHLRQNLMTYRGKGGN